MIKAFLRLITKALFFGGHLAWENSYPKPLPKSEEAECFRLMKNGDSAARDKLILHNMDDLISVGSIGLIKGIESFDAEKCTALATFLARCIENEILMTLRSQKKHGNNVYISDPVGIDPDGNEYTLMDILSVREESVFRQVEQNVLSQKLNDILKNALSEREYFVVCCRYGLNNTPVLTQLQTAKKLRISRSYVSRIESKALEKLRDSLVKGDFD